jgi:hypothetical protein
MGMRYDLDYRCVCTSYNRVDKDGHDKEDKNEEHQLEKTDIGQSLVLRKKDICVKHTNNRFFGGPLWLSRRDK